MWVVFAAWALYLWYGLEHATELAVPCTAKRAISRNHRIAASDLTCTPEGVAARYAGMYASRDIAAASPVHLPVVVDAPELRLSPGEVVFQLNRPNSVPATMDAGTVLQLRVPTAKEAISARLIAVTCDSQRDNVCKPIFAVREGALSALAQADPSTIQANVPTNQSTATPSAVPKQQQAPAAPATAPPAQPPAQRTPGTKTDR